MSTKTIEQIITEVQQIENEFKERLLTYIRENPEISISMDIKTKKEYTDLKTKEPLISNIDVELFTDINLGQKNHRGNYQIATTGLDKAVETLETLESFNHKLNR